MYIVSVIFEILGWLLLVVPACFLVISFYMVLKPGQQERQLWCHRLAMAIHVIVGLSCLFHLLYLPYETKLHPELYNLSRNLIMWLYSSHCLTFWLAISFVLLKYRKAVWFLLGCYALILIANPLVYGKFIVDPNILGLLTIPLHRKAWNRYE